ncbi:pancreatic triacylglycerol lipase isoform X2 [Orussus abietinus]|uniref:pancreatic triacylglycerol lipase isoform X2 n=1 Tax=Orussus abietinus TaxID=222816 RepID=UPI0006253F3D|nr:pancreatic triacylglycerol lipase isoform X2 [Orussus abietinus]
MTSAWALFSPNPEKLLSIYLRLYNGDTLDEFVDVYVENATMLLPKMQLSRKTAFYIHGYTESVDSNSVKTIVGGYLKRQDHNIIAVDWSKLAASPYISAISNSKDVGITIARAIQKMVEGGLSREKIHVIGHSLGAQVAGFLGKNSNFPIPRITGLDPAGPFYNLVIPHLEAGDADFVDIIHTDAGIYGTRLVTGSVDFFPNGGVRVQPGCPATFEIESQEDFCSHHRSWVFYAESLTDEDSFIGRNCSSYLRFTTGECDNNDTAVMGYATPPNTNGTFYLKTNSQSPYGRKLEGAEGSL